MKQKVLITGGTGLVGQAITLLLKDKNYEVAVLSRKHMVEGINSFYWNYEKGEIDDKAIDFADVIIHLAGENISSKKWTLEQKRKIIDSRVQTTNLLKSAIEKSNNKPKAFLSASAIGYYGSMTSDLILTEDDDAGVDFLAETVVKWEESVKQIQQLGVPAAALRVGVVMSTKGGALSKMMIPIKLGVGSPIGTGKQWVPWISLNDLARMFVFVLEEKLFKQTSSEFLLYNATSPGHITNSELTKQLAILIKRPYFLPAIPSIVLKLLFGEMSIILLNGSRVSSEKIQDAGFKFQNPEIGDVFK